MQASLLAKQAITGLRRSHAAALVPSQGSMAVNAPDYRILGLAGQSCTILGRCVPDCLAKPRALDLPCECGTGIAGNAGKFLRK